MVSQELYNERISINAIGKNEKTLFLLFFIDLEDKSSSK